MSIRYISLNVKGIFSSLIYDTYFHRSMDSHTLVANIGGYIGLCLGYNLLQVPDLITTVFRKLKDHFKSQKMIKNYDNISNTFDTNDNNENGHDERQKKN